MILDLFAAGTETTSTTLQWLLMYMMYNQEVQEKCREEIHQVGSDQYFQCKFDCINIATQGSIDDKYLFNVRSFGTEPYFMFSGGCFIILGELPKWIFMITYFRCRKIILMVWSYFGLGIRWWLRIGDPEPSSNFQTNSHRRSVLDHPG